MPDEALTNATDPHTVTLGRDGHPAACTACRAEADGEGLDATVVAVFRRGSTYRRVFRDYRSANAYALKQQAHGHMVGLYAARVVSHRGGVLELLA